MYKSTYLSCAAEIFIANASKVKRYKIDHDPVTNIFTRCDENGERIFFASNIVEAYEKIQELD